MSLTDWLVAVQATSMLALAPVFWAAGNHRLAVAQLCYGVATIVLFAGRS